MPLEQTLNDTLTKAIKEKDARTADVVRMIKSKIGERRTAKGFSGTVDDPLVLDVIGAYRKQLQKALVEFEKVGERGAAHAAQLRFELEFCEGYLPKGMDEAALRALVRERLDALKIADAKQVGPEQPARLRLCFEASPGRAADAARCRAPSSPSTRSRRTAGRAKPWSSATRLDGPARSARRAGRRSAGLPLRSG